MTHRFETLLTQLGRDVIAKSSQLEIKMYRCHGKLCATFELHGSVGTDPFEDEDDDEDEDEGDLLAKRKQNDMEDMKFIVDLMTQFEREH